MRTIDIRDYVVARWGDWVNEQGAFTATLFRLDHSDDGVTLSGPLRVQVSVQARNVFQFPGVNRLAFQSKEIFCYVLEIPPGQTWSYPGPRRVLQPWEYVAAPPPARYAADRIVATSADANSTLTIHTDDPNAYGFGTSGGTDQPVHTATPVTPPPANINNPGWVVVPPPPPAGGTQVPPPRPTIVMPPPPRFGTNAGVSVVIRPAGSASCQDPCIDPCADPCATTTMSRCGCGSTCGCGSSSGQCGCGNPKAQCGCSRPSNQCGCGGIETLPCDFAVASRPNAGRFFPAGCETCSPSAIVAMPALQGPALLVPPARGGTVRTRYFTGMFIGKEDLETDQRNVRLKRALMNRAMGQGVVWGLGVGLDGDGVCVLPGYGVDCCGNDLILSQTYRVEGAALVRDPAAQAILATPGQQRLSLVLEYYECPESPRPVHGDPCANDSRCEPSRMRETVRLRLAQPCEVDDSGPIQDYLDEVAALKKSVNASGVAGAPQLTSFIQPTVTSQPIPAPRVPFSVSIEDSGGNSLQAIQPQVNAESRGDSLLPSPGPGQLPTLTIVLKAEAGVSFRGAPVIQVLTFDPQTGTTQQIAKSMQTTSSPSMTSWDVPIPGLWWNAAALNTTPIPPAMSFAVGPWEMQDQNGATFQGTTEVDLTPMRARYWYQTPWGKASAFKPDAKLNVLDAAVRATNVTVTVSRPPTFPCLSEPCGDGSTKLFPVMPPFMHEDPTAPGQPADGKVVMLAMLYAYTTGTMAKYRAGTPYQIQSAQTDLAAMLGRVSSQLFFAKTTAVQQTQLVGALQRLLEAWCRGLLYPGPKCCCDPHGAVIGCATVEGGVIQSVDPWGGRRWVMHYPLLAYWGRQFGIMPPDVIASKLFDLICCIANVGASRPPSATGSTDSVGQWPSTPQPIPLGRMLVFTGTHQEVTDSLASANVTAARAVHLSPMDFISRVTRGSQGADAGAAQPLVRVSVAGVPGITVVMPDDEAPAPTPSAGAAAPSATAARPTPLSDIVRSASSRTGKTAVPLLLRGLAESIASKIADAMPLNAETSAESAEEQLVIKRLNDAGITSLARLLNKDPETLHNGVLQKESAREFGAVLDRTAKLVQALADKVSDVLASYAQEHGLASRDAFADPQIAGDFAKTLGAALKRAKLAAPSDEVVAAAVAAATSAT